jgi:hypothetical protein
MATRVNVTSLDAISDFRANLVLYVSKAKPALEEVTSDVNRLRQWIEVTQRGYWAGVAKQRTRELEEARAAVFSAKLSNFREVASAEQIALTKAKRAYDEVEAKMRVIKKWSREFDNRVAPLAKQLEKVHTILAEDMTRAIHSLSETVRALDDYAGMIAPSLAVETAPPTDAIAAGLVATAPGDDPESEKSRILSEEAAEPDSEGAV